MLVDVSNVDDVYHSTRTDSDPTRSFTIDAMNCYVIFGEAQRP